MGMVREAGEKVRGDEDRIVIDPLLDDIVDQAIAPAKVPIDHVVKLAAVDSEFFGSTFFPQTFRQKSPVFAREQWEPLENPLARLVNMVTFRGGRKTSLLRVFTAKRISYRISRTILYIGASEADAIRSVQWLKNRVDRNKLWTDTFGLSRGKKWEETQVEIRQELPGDKEPRFVYVLAAGMTGSLRGINFDDFRPDLIILDDPQTDETAATETQREKISDLVFGAVKNSLAPAVDEPNSKMVMNITPQHPEDISQQALKDPEFVSVVFPCWTRETLELPVDQQESSWPDRYPTIDLRNEKKSAMQRNRLSVFTREKECRLTSKETATFKPFWLRVRQANITHRGLFTVLAIDPVPPPSPKQQQSGLQKKDFEAHYVWGRRFVDGEVEYHLLDFDRNRGHEPSWTCATAFRLGRQWRTARWVFDAVAYQRTLKWILEQEMRRRGEYYTVIPISDGMQKFARIENVLSGLASAGKLWIGQEHTIFAEQFSAFGPTYQGIDDDLDSSALCVQELANPWLERLDEKGQISDDNVEDFPYVGACP